MSVLTLASRRALASAAQSERVETLLGRKSSSGPIVVTVSERFLVITLAVILQIILMTYASGTSWGPLWAFGCITCCVMDFTGHKKGSLLSPRPMTFP